MSLPIQSKVIQSSRIVSVVLMPVTHGSRDGMRLPRQSSPTHPYLEAVEEGTPRLPSITVVPFRFVSCHRHPHPIGMMRTRRNGKLQKRTFHPESGDNLHQSGPIIVVSHRESELETSLALPGTGRLACKENPRQPRPLTTLPRANKCQSVVGHCRAAPQLRRYTHART